ncbi:MAG: enoyl-CoA hydratase/isomerase family protein [Nitrososphaerales archaeon]
MFSRIICEKKSGVCTVTLNRPEKLNALDRTMRQELDSAFADVASDRSIRVIIVQGAGRSFCAGADVSQFLSGELGTSGAVAMITRHLLKTIESCPQIVVFKLHGHVLGGGLEMALAGDLRIASDDSELGFPETGIGMIPGSGGTQRLPRIVGFAKAKEMLFLGSRISASEAERIGLVHRAVPKDKLDSSVDEITAQLLKRAPVALAAAKSAVNKVWDYTNLDSGLVWERELVNLCAETHDRREGLLAMKEKRAPNFNGV